MAQADAKYFVQAIFDVATPGGKKAEQFANSIVSAGKRIQRMGPSISGTFFRMRNAIFAAGGAYGIGSVIRGAIDANREIENLNFSVATTLQLFGRNANEIDAVTGKILGARTESEQFAANLAEAGAATDKLFRIAATSPASFQQAQELFNNVLPGLSQVEGSMENMLEFTKKSLAVGTLIGGDFQQAGADLRRILTGQAGMDVRSWSEGMGTAVKRAAKTMGPEYAKLGKQSGAAFTQAFNKMDPAQRYKLVQAALKDMGASTEAAGETWDGLTSAISSDVFLIKKALGESMFEGLKERFKAMVGEGGIANPLSKSFARLEDAAKVAGSFLADAAGTVLDKIVRGAQYMADNWEDVYKGLHNAFSFGMKMAKLMVATRAMQFAAGGAVSAMGKGVRGGQKLTSFIKGFFVQGEWDQAAGRFRDSSGKFLNSSSQMAQKLKALVGSMGGLGMSLGVVAPLTLIAASALAGVAVMFGGVVAYLVDNWDALVSAIMSGAVTLKPLTDALGLLWAKMVGLGKAIVGDNGIAGATGMLQKIILFAAKAVHWLIGAFAFFLKAAGAVQFAYNMITAGLKTIGVAFLSLIRGILTAVQSALSYIPGYGEEEGMVGRAIGKIDGMMSGMLKSIKKDGEEAFEMFELAKKFEDIQDDGTFAKALEEKFAKALEGGGKSGGKGFGGGKTENSKEVNIHNLTINQDLRNEDPDRIMGAFTKELERVSNQPTQAVTMEDYGI